LFNKGGNAALVLSQYLINKDSPVRAKLQLLIYPWLQKFSLITPSMIHYRDKVFIDGNAGQLILYYLGYTNQTQEMKDAINSNNHILLLDEQTRKLFYSYLDTDLIPDVYKEGCDYYKNGKHAELLAKIPAKLDDTNVLVRDTEFANRLKRVFTPDLSPGLVDDEYLKKLPSTYQIVCEWDGLKDDDLIFGERLKRAGVESHIAFYKTCFHGLVSSLEQYDLAPKIFEDLVKYMENNV
jgi:acetyl esterase/lipase